MTKRILFIKIWVVLITIIMIGAEAIFLISPSYRQLTQLRNEQTNLIGQVAGAASRFDYLSQTSTRQAEIIDLEQKLKTWLPEIIDQNDFIVQFNDLTKSQGIVLSSLSFDTKLQNALSFQGQASGTFQELLSLLSNLKRLERLIALDSLSLTAASPDNQYVISGKSFYQAIERGLDPANQRLPADLESLKALVRPSDRVRSDENLSESPEPLGNLE